MKSERIIDRTAPARWATRLEWGLCLLATLAAAGLHAVYLTHAGGLWRDEASSVYLATLPSLGQVWALLGHESFPVLFLGIVRGWSALGLGHSDFGLRLLGFFIGLSVLIGLWLNARLFGSTRPTVSLAMLAVNLTLVRWGDSMRAFGLGCFLILLTLGLVWSAMSSPSRGRFVAAAVAAVLSVQCLYQNAFLLLAICGAGCVVCFRCKQDKLALGILALGLPAALSLLPYVGVIAGAQSWWVVEKTGFAPGVVFGSLAQAVGSPSSWLVVPWIAICSLAVARGFQALRKSQRRKSVGTEHRSLFAALALVLGFLAFVSFLMMSKLPPKPWYWLPPVALAAGCLDPALGNWFESRRAWWWGLVLVMVCAPLAGGVKLAAVRQTNIDLVAERLRQEVKPNDFIVVYPWYLGITFNRYFKEPTPWSTIPELSDLRCHRYDLVKERLAAADPIQSVLDRAGRALTSGSRVWIVGKLPEAEPGEVRPPELPPAPQSVWGWADFPYSYVWGRQAESFLTAHGGRAETVPLPVAQSISEYENAPLSVARGWSLLPDARP